MASGVPSRQDTAFSETPAQPCFDEEVGQGSQQGQISLSLEAGTSQPRCTAAERSLVPAGRQHRTLSATSQEQLSQDIIRDVLDGLPPEAGVTGVTDAAGPYLRVERVLGDGRALDVTVVHRFRAHYAKALAASPDLASPVLGGEPPVGANSAGSEAAAPAAGAAAQGGARLEADGGSSLRVEELPCSSSEGLGCAPAGHLCAAPAGQVRRIPSAHAAHAAAAASAEGCGVPNLACKMEVPASAYSGGSGSSSSGHCSSTAVAAQRAELTGVQRSDGDPSASAAAADTWAVAQQHAQQERHQREQQQQQQQQEHRPGVQGASPAGTPLAPPSVWEPSGAAAAEVQRRFSQDRLWEARVALAGRQDSLVLYEIDPHDLRVGERLAVGGFAEVFVGQYQGTPVAIKLLLSVDERGQESFRNEVHILERLRHPSIVQFIGISSRPYLAILSEYMARGSLFKLLRKGGNRPLPHKLQKAVAVSVARGMCYLHTRRPAPLLHLDLKSANILLDDRWRVKIADFGLSTLKSSAGMQGTGAGTPEWMAPEVLRCESYDERADVYSYGCVLWEVLTGDVPWGGLTAIQVVGAVGFQRMQLPLEGAEGEPFMVDLCRRCLSLDPQDRPTFPRIMQELEHHYAPSSRSNSLGSNAGGEASLAASGAITTPAAAAAEHGGEAGGAHLAPNLGLRLPAAALRHRNGRPQAQAPGVPPAGPHAEVGNQHGQHSAHSTSPFAPARPPPSLLPGPAPPGAEYSPFGAVVHVPGEEEREASQPSAGDALQPLCGAQQQQPPQLPAAAHVQASPFGEPLQQQQGFGSPPRPAAPAAALHPAFSLTNRSPFAQLPPFGDEDEEAGAAGAEKQGSEQSPELGHSALEAIAEGDGGGSSSSSSSTACHADAVAAAVAAAERLHLSGRSGASQLSGSSSSSEGFSGDSRLSVASLLREPSSQLLTLAEAVAGRTTSMLSPGDSLAMLVPAGGSQPCGKPSGAGSSRSILAMGLPGTPQGPKGCGAAEAGAEAGSTLALTSRTVASLFGPPSQASSDSSSAQEAALWRSLDDAAL